MSQPLLVGGVPVLKESGLKAVPASGMYIDELRISRIARYNVGAYNVPASAFTADDDTLGLYHFDGKSTERYEDASLHRIPLIRTKKKDQVRLKLVTFFAKCTFSTAKRSATSIETGGFKCLHSSGVLCKLKGTFVYDVAMPSHCLCFPFHNRTPWV